MEKSGERELHENRPKNFSFLLAVILGYSRTRVCPSVVIPPDSLLVGWAIPTVLFLTPNFQLLTLNSTPNFELLTSTGTPL